MSTHPPIGREQIIYISTGHLLYHLVSEAEIWSIPLSQNKRQ